jgi:hypothetical protein
MSSPKISITSNPAGQTGWFGRVLAGIGVLVVIIAGIGISPAARSAGHGWTESTRAIQAVPPTAAIDRSDVIDAGSPIRRVVRPVRNAPRADVDPPESVASNDAGGSDRPSLVRRFLTAVATRTKAELDRRRRMVVTAAAE